MGGPINILNKKLEIPASNARITFMNNSADIRDYFALHQLAFKGASKGIQRLSHLLDKSTYVLVASLWEAYCEDLVTECLDHITQYAPTYHALPYSIREDIQKGMRSGKDSPWDLAGDGWREYVRNRNRGFEKKRNKDFAGPKSAAVEEFFLSVLGIENLCSRWQISGSPGICDDLDAHLELRNRIIHQFTPGRVVNKNDVKKFCRTAISLVACTDMVVDEFLVQTTGESRWMSMMAATVADSGESSRTSGQKHS
jgi:RiboL-PSP-HEPN